MGANIPAVSTSDKMFEQISNIGKFLDFVKSTGVADRDLFVTTDLYDNKRHEAGDDWIELSRSSASQGAWIRWSKPCLDLKFPDEARLTQCKKMLLVPECAQCPNAALFLTAWAINPPVGACALEAKHSACLNSASTSELRMQKRTVNWPELQLLKQQAALSL
jgi:hypothetical protein